MPIGVEWQDEDGRLLARYDGPLLQAKFLGLAERGGSCLQFIDPYGDTTFNQLQVPALLDELERLAADRDLGEQLAIVRALLTFIERARDQTHTYIKFIGD